MSKADKTRQFIIEKTAPLFNTKGYTGTSLHDMTEATGLTKGSIYGNFKNKEEVALAAFNFNVQKLLQEVFGEVRKQNTYLKKLLAYPVAYEKLISNSFIIGGCPILNTAIEADDTDEILKRQVARVIITWKEEIETLLLAGIEAGELKSSMDAEQEALTIIATLEGAIMITKITSNENYFKKIAKIIKARINSLAQPPS